MITELERQRSGGELVFTLLKTLMTGYHRWGAECVLNVGDLAGCLRTSDKRLTDLIVYLAGEGLVVSDNAAGTVRLSEHGVRHLLHQQHVTH